MRAMQRLSMGSLGLLSGLCVAQVAYADPEGPRCRDVTFLRSPGARSTRGPDGLGTLVCEGLTRTKAASGAAAWRYL